MGSRHIEQGSFHDVIFNDNLETEAPKQARGVAVAATAAVGSTKQANETDRAPFT